jgi:hypothetical protein
MMGTKFRDFLKNQAGMSHVCIQYNHFNINMLCVTLSSVTFKTEKKKTLIKLIQN